MHDFCGDIDKELTRKCLEMGEVLEELCDCINMALLGTFNDFVISDFIQHYQVSRLNSDNCC